MPNAAKKKRANAKKTPIKLPAARNRSKSPALKAVRESPTPAVAPAPPAPPRPAYVTITAAKGRPMLTWVGKRPLAQITAFPAQHIETYAAAEPTAQPLAWPDWPASYPQGGLLFHGDNKEVLAHLLAN